MFSLNAANQASPKSGQFTATLDQRQSLKIVSLKSIAWRNGFISAEQLEQQAQPLAANGYDQYMSQLLAKSAQP